jgi:hypothetical protein
MAPIGKRKPAPRRLAPEEPVRVGRGAVHVVRSSEPPPFGRTTVRFFDEGDRHEAAGWRDVVLPPDDETEPSVKAGSFDRVPRQRGAMIVLAVFGVALVAGVGYGAHFLYRAGWHLDSSAAAYSQPPQPTAIPPGAAAPAFTPFPIDGGADDDGGSGDASAAAVLPASPHDEAAATPPPVEPSPATKAAAPAKTERANRADERGKRETAKPAQRTRARGPRAALPVEEVLDRQSDPTTTGALAAPESLDETTPTIAPPPALVPPPEKAPPIPEAEPLDP